MEIKINFDNVKDLFNEDRVKYQIEQQLNQAIIDKIYYDKEFQDIVDKVTADVKRDVLKTLKARIYA